jgi:ABC-2 type transport system ATP-binding protein
MRMLLGLVRPTAGSVQLLGFDMSRKPLRALARTGAIIEAPAFYENFSALRNLTMLSELSGGANSKRIAAALETVGLTERAHDPVRIYSHGMCQRLGIAQALLPNPEFILLDEPTDGLDPQGIREMRSLIVRLRDEYGLTIMLSSHLLHEVEQICNRVAIIDEGSIVYQGSVQELVGKDTLVKIKVNRVDEAFAMLSGISSIDVNRNGDEFLYVKTCEGEIGKINTLLVNSGFQVHELSPQRQTLEEVFLQLTR